MVTSFVSPFGNGWTGGADRPVVLSESGSRRFWPSPVPAHAIFTPPPPAEDNRFANDFHVGRGSGGPWHAASGPNPS
jgi:hypothetical protein